MDEVTDSVAKLYEWIDDSGLAGWDPYDALVSNLVRKLTMGNKWLRLAAVQLNKRSPINFRKALGIKMEVHPKTLALFSRAFINLYRLWGDTDYLNKAKTCLEHLKEEMIIRPSGYCWGPHRAYQTIGGYVEKKEPAGALTAVIGNSFLEAFEISGDEEYLKIPIKCCDFLVDEMLIKKDNIAFFKYSMHDNEDEVIYNAQAFIAAFLARVYKHTGEKELLRYATELIEYLISMQRESGMWFYGKSSASIYRQIDFHQGFILDGICDFMMHTGIKDERYLNALKKGAEFYKNEQFLTDGRAKWRWPRVGPIDIHNQAQGIITFSKLSDINPEYLGVAKKIALWTIKNMQEESGYFYYQKHRFYMNKIPYMRWGQAWMMLALTTLLEAIKERE